MAWTRALTFPGLEPGERLVVHERLPKGRGRILDRSGAVLAQGPVSARTYPQGSAFAVVTGYLKAPAATAVAARVRAGWPAKLPYGQGGLEGSLDPILAGTPRFGLRAVSKTTGHIRVLALRPGRSPRNVTTTLRVPVQDAAVAALGARYGGVVVLSARTGAVEADAGLGLDLLQPPGSSFKTITSAAALTAGKTTLDTEYTYARYALLDGWRLHNFHHEVVRRVTGARLRRELQLRVRAARGVGGGSQAGGDGRCVRVQPSRLDRLSGARERDPAAVGDDLRPRPGRRRHRPGRRARLSAADGLGGPDDRLGLRPPAALPDPPAACARESRTCPCGRARGISRPR